MQINWFTVIAQILNFFVLVWLLKRYLYKPILNAIDEREQKIAAQLKEAADNKAEAIKEQEDFKYKNELFDQERKALMDNAVAETKEARQKLLDDVRNEASALQSKLEKESKVKQQSINQAIAQKTIQEVFAIARKTLDDLASVGLEEQSVHVFTQRIKALKATEKKQFMEAFKGDSTPLMVRSAYELPEKQRNVIKDAIHNILGTKAKFEFEIKPELISGIELSTNGYKMAWSIARYLDSLEKSIPKITEAKRT